MVKVGDQIPMDNGEVGTVVHVSPSYPKGCNHDWPDDSNGMRGKHRDSNKADCSPRSRQRPTRQLFFCCDRLIRAKEKCDHPTQKWLPMMEKIVASIVKPGGVALDPFMGSGSTGVAAVSSGRRFIGIEIEPRYFDMACQRVEDVQRQVAMFGA